MSEEELQISMEKASRQDDAKTISPAEFFGRAFSVGPVGLEPTTSGL